MLFTEDRLLIFWDTKSKRIPPRPQKPERFPQTDERHWYDMEYAGWGIQKVNIPESPGSGAKGRRVVFLQPGMHPYHVAFAEGLARIAERSGVRLVVHTADNTMEGQARQVELAIRERPDLVILVPIDSVACTKWAKDLNAHGIPVIASNFLLPEEAHRYVLSWCGPDDWGQFRLLARKFAELAGYRGGYAIVRHWPGTSCFHARTWSVVTELRKAAPAMSCLAMSHAGEEGRFDPGEVETLVAGWVRQFGADLRGIVCPDDYIVIDGVNQALRTAGREDIIRVAAGSSQKGMQLVKEGRLHAITYQSAQADGALPMKVAVDWFDGLSIEPINYLPKYIITKENVEDFLSKKPEFSSVSLELLTRAILAGSEAQVDQFFEDAYQSFLTSELMTQEFFRGFSIEVLSTVLHVLKNSDLDEQELVPDFESLYKNLFNQKTPKAAMDWMRRLSMDVVRRIAAGRREESPIDGIVRYVARNFAAPLSLKVLACQFNLSPAYLGRLFRRATGKPFATYLNELRLRKADEMLKYSSLKESEIAVRIGYANVNYFYTLFRKYKGSYPSASRSRACREDDPPASRGSGVHSLKQK
jgi:ABC-type sugar transport system substrate-binding protein/AraC-like DNA-binding protein